ncbi:hypothetical protein [Sulfuricurvum sp.]|uniref:hypothetical protein n=1 Tax=Sulfuricurvum sp. TaxID=2025608 RepID=UPI003563041F
MVIKVQPRQVMPQAGEVPTPQPLSPIRGAFGENIAQAQGNMGEAVGSFAQVLQGRALQKQKDRNDRYMLDQDANYRRSVNDKLFDQGEEYYVKDGQKIKRKKGILLREGASALGATEEFDRWSQEQVKKMLALAPTDEMRNSIIESSGRFTASVRNNIISHEVKQDNMITQVAYESEMDALTNNDATFATNGGLPNLLQSIRKTSDEYAASKGIIDSTAKNAFAQSYINKAVDTAIQSAFVEDASGIKAFTVLEQAKKDLGPYYEEKKQSMIAIFDKQQAVNNFQAVLAKNSLDDNLKSLAVSGELTMSKLNTLRDQNPFQLDEKMYNGYKKMIESQKAVFGTADTNVGYEMLSEFSKIFGTIKEGDLKKKSGQGKFDDVLKLRARIIDERTNGNVDDDMLSMFNKLFEATTTQNKNFVKYSTPYLSELTNMENFAKKVRVQELQTEGTKETMANDLVYKMFAELVTLTGGNKLQPIKNANELKVLQSKAEEVRRAFSAEIAKKRYNIQKNEDDGFEYVTSPDGSSFKVVGYSYGEPLIDFKEGIK